MDIEMKGRTHLYILGVCFSRKGKYFAKVGISKNIKSRIADLQTGCPEKIKPLAACEIPLKGALGRERALHIILSEFQTQGEWFLLNEKSYKLMTNYFLNLLMAENTQMMRFERIAYSRDFHVFPDNSNYLYHKLRINNLTGRPALNQGPSPEFILFRNSL